MEAEALTSLWPEPIVLNIPRTNPSLGVKRMNDLAANRLGCIQPSSGKYGLSEVGNRRLLGTSD